MSAIQRAVQNFQIIDSIVLMQYGRAILRGTINAGWNVDIEHPSRRAKKNARRFREIDIVDVQGRCILSTASIHDDALRSVRTVIDLIYRVGRSTKNHRRRIVGRLFYRTVQALIACKQKQSCGIAVVARITGA